jgi:sulfatase maturation enzyme AslB (radical SAM superfamily)
MKPWCTEPFITLENKVYGPWGLCCRSKPLPYGQEVSPLEHFNSETMRRIRSDMLQHNITDEIKSLCRTCILHEKKGLTSRRQGKDYLEIPLTENDGTINNFKFNTVEIKFFGNLCNLKCKMCNGELSSSIAAEEKKAGLWKGPIIINAYELTDKNKFYTDMGKILPYTKMIKFTGGEPTMNAGIVDFIQWIVDKKYSRNLELKIITNGTKQNNKIIELSKSFKNFIIGISVDGTFEIDEYQRVGTFFEDVIESIKIYKSVGMVKLNPVITAINVGNLPELIAFSKVMNVPIDLTSIAINPSHMRIDVLPITYRKYLLSSYNYPKEIHTALESEYWDQEGWNKLLQLNPDIFDVISELKGFTS